ncbi:MAG: tetratricopeptide repeat protein [Firmicutes bacterium]|nr:tetratricopeptide repeat protein [Bacillota bacterium]
MNPFRSRLVLLLVTLVCGLSAFVQAGDAPVDWFDHGFGSSIVVAESLEGDDKILLMHGYLTFAYPEGFQLQYAAWDVPVTITSQADFLEVQRGSDFQYGYERYWLFEDFKNHIFALAEYSRLPLEFSGREAVAERAAKRFTALDDPQFLLWFDEESGLPLLIRRNKQTLLTVTSYLLEEGQLVEVELDIFFGPRPARITLRPESVGWVPSRLEIHDPPGEVHISFSDWSFREEWEENPLPRLAELSSLNELFMEEFNAENFAAALETSQQMLTLAPQFWQVYLYRAFAYDGLDNFLGVVESYQQVLMRQPDNHLALNNLAYHYFLREVQIDKALDMAERAVELERRDIYLDTLGYGYYLVGRYEEARELFLEALETAPDDAVEEITAHLDLVLEALGDTANE